MTCFRSGVPVLFFSIVAAVSPFGLLKRAPISCEDIVLYRIRTYELLSLPPHPAQFRNIPRLPFFSPFSVHETFATPPLVRNPTTCHSTMPMAPCLFGAKDNTTVGRLHKLCPHNSFTSSTRRMNNEHMEIGVVVFYSPRFASAYRAGFAVAGCHSHENMCMPSVALTQNHAIIVCIAGHYAQSPLIFFLMGPWAKNKFYASFLRACMHLKE